MVFIMAEINIFEFLFDEGKRIFKILKKDNLGALRCEKNMYEKYYEPYLGREFPAKKQNMIEQLEYDEYKRIFEEVARRKSDAELECVINSEREHKLKRDIFKIELDRRNNSKR